MSRLPGKRARPVLRGPRRSNAPGLPAECEFTALRYFTLDGSDYPSHPAQEAAIAGYIRWANRRARPKQPSGGPSPRNSSTAARPSSWRSRHDPPPRTDPRTTGPPGQDQEHAITRFRKTAGQTGRVVFVGAGPGDPGMLTARATAAFAEAALVLVDPDGIIRWVDVNDLSVGRSVDEVLRVLDALQTDELCPCNWRKGDPTLQAA